MMYSTFGSLNVVRKNTYSHNVSFSSKYSSDLIKLFSYIVKCSNATNVYLKYFHVKYLKIRRKWYFQPRFYLRTLDGGLF